MRVHKILTLKKTPYFIKSVRYKCYISIWRNFPGLWEGACVSEANETRERRRASPLGEGTAGDPTEEGNGQAARRGETPYFGGEKENSKSAKKSFLQENVSF